LELETLGPLTLLEPGEELEHVEDWYLYDGIPLPTNEAGVQANVLPVVNMIG
jgi:hypothetical protein